jgi:protein-tyrosine phosphatase
MAEILRWQDADRQAVVSRAAEVLVAGDLVVFPTDHTYAVAANALVPEAVDRLVELCGENGPLSVALTSVGQALDWAPEMSPLGRRLARRVWPGPVTLVLTAGVERGLASQLPETVRRQLCPDGAVGLCVPGHDAPWLTLRLLPVPLVLGAIAGNGEGTPTTAARAAHVTGDRVRLVIDGGPSRDAQPASVVRVEGDRFEVLREGSVSAEELAQQTTCVIVFVCTGNTCRSPMAEVLCKKLLADRLGCSVAELPARGFLVLSAGVSAVPGDRAAAEAVEVARDLGADLSGHASRPLTPDLVLQADHIIAMTHGHAQALAARFGQHAPAARLLCPEGGDIGDPIGRDQEVYRQCAQQILQGLERLLPRLGPA